jgi:hypothetical protein
MYSICKLRATPWQRTPHGNGPQELASRICCSCSRQDLAHRDRTDLRDRMSAFGSAAEEIGRAASVESVANDPNVWSGRALQEDFVDLADAALHQCIRSLIGARSGSRPSWISARVRVSLAVRPQAGRSGHQCSHAPGRPILHLVSSSRRPRRVVTSSIVVHWRRSFVRALRPFLRPDLRAQARRAQETVKAGRRAGLASCSCASRPRLDGLEHGARLKLVGVSSHLS